MNPSTLKSVAGPAQAAAAPAAVPPATAPSAPAPPARKGLVDSAAAGGPPGGSAPLRPAAATTAREPVANRARADGLARPPAADVLPPSLHRMVTAQQAMALGGIQAQTLSAELDMQHQQTAAAADASVQLVTRLAESAKDGIKALGDSFSKAG
jgi:hypothetical protein